MYNCYGQRGAHSDEGFQSLESERQGEYADIRGGVTENRKVLSEVRGKVSSG